MKNLIKNTNAQTAAAGFAAKIKAGMLFMFLMIAGLTSEARSAENAATKADAARVTAMRQRVEQIQAMDLEHLSVTERKEVRQELKEMKKELRTLGPTYVYISGAGLLLIIILLILLL